MRSLLLTSTCLLFALLLITPLNAQIDARMFRDPDVSATQITFVYAGDIWVVPKTGGTAAKLSSPPGPESNPRFSPDGSRIAFSGNYDGNTDVYVVSSMGGTPQRLTYHGGGDQVIDWHPTGDRVLFTSGRESGRQRYSQFYTVPATGGMAEKLPVPYGEFGTYSPDGSRFVYTPRDRSTRTWKRYRGGMANDLYLFNLNTLASERITETGANEELPLWHGEDIYFLSDRGPNKRHNLYVYNLQDKQTTQLTKFADFDVHFPSIGPDDLVFEAGGKLYRMDLATRKYEEVNIDVITDQASLKPRTEPVGSMVQDAFPSPDGKRVIVQARGELFSVPAEHGYIKNLTASPGVAERYPAWSPDGRSLVYWSDRGGEYELTLRDMSDPAAEEKLTSYGRRYRYQPQWSPDSKKIAFLDNDVRLHVYNRETGETRQADQFEYWINHGSLENLRLSWSPDSRWLAFSKQAETGNSALFLYDYQENELHQLTAGYYNDSGPVFDRAGNHLFFRTNRHFNPLYSDMDNSFVYPNATQLAAVTLRKDLPSPLAPRNDEATVAEEDEKEDEKGEKDEEKKEEEADENITIDLDGFERRIVLLPVDPGNFGRLAAAEGKLIFHRAPNSGSDAEERPLRYFDLEEREEKTIIDDIDDYRLTAKGEQVLVAKNGKLALIKVAEGQKMEKPLRTDEMEMTLDPQAEWRQIFDDAWRFQRDFFYDPGMHGVDWDAMRTRYGALIDDAVTRWDVNYVLGELIGELNASHTYRGGGDTENAKRRPVGYLGVDWSVSGDHYRIDRIIRGAPWDAETRSPFDQPGLDVREGDLVLAVNGNPLTADREPYAAFQGLSGKTVELRLRRPSADTTWTVVVETLPGETRLRHLAWIESNRQRVAEASDGRIGYVYVRSTGIDGQNELVRQFQAQYRKEGLIVDERFNSGGQIPDRFVELLDRPPLAYWDVRVGKSWQWPPVAHFGPKVMLINGWSGSGGDAFPDYFRKAGLGPLIGTRTWGGLIGISGAPSLIDGGVVTVPTFRMYDPDGTWFKEGYGVDPDIEVPEDPTQLAKGTDTQLERAIQEVLQQLKEKPAKPVPPPAPEVRSE